MPTNDQLSRVFTDGSPMFRYRMPGVTKQPRYLEKMSKCPRNVLTSDYLWVVAAARWGTALARVATFECLGRPHASHDVYHS